jgi:hypothetical protein
VRFTGCRCYPRTTCSKNEVLRIEELRLRALEGLEGVTMGVGRSSGAVRVLSPVSAPVAALVGAVALLLAAARGL